MSKVSRREGNKFFYTYRGVEYSLAELHALCPDQSLRGLRNRLSNPKYTVERAVEQPADRGVHVDAARYDVVGVMMSVGQVKRHFDMTCSSTWLSMFLRTPSVGGYAARVYEAVRRYGRGEVAEDYVRHRDSRVQQSANAVAAESTNRRNTP